MRGLTSHGLHALICPPVIQREAAWVWGIDTRYSPGGASDRENNLWNGPCHPLQSDRPSACESSTDKLVDGGDICVHSAEHWVFCCRGYGGNCAESLETSPFLLFVLNDQIIESEMNQHISLIFQERILSTLSFKERSGWHHRTHLNIVCV